MHFIALLLVACRKQPRRKAVASGGSRASGSTKARNPSRHRLQREWRWPTQAGCERLLAGTEEGRDTLRVLQPQRHTPPPNQRTDEEKQANRHRQSPKQHRSGHSFRKPGLHTICKSRMNNEQNDRLAQPFWFSKRPLRPLPAPYDASSGLQPEAPNQHRKLCK